MMKSVRTRQKKKLSGDITINQLSYDKGFVSYSVNENSQPNNLAENFSQTITEVITIKDIAKITKDGAVVGGNKIKMGLPIVLEGVNYKFGGTVSDVRVYSETQIDGISDNSNMG